MRASRDQCPINTTERKHVNYAAATKTSRMTQVRTDIDAGGAAGKMELGTTGMALVLATIALGFSGVSTATIAGSVMTFAGFPRSDASADASGIARVARIRTSANADVITDMTVGLNSTVAPAWAASTVVPTGAKRTNGANIYNATVGGTTAASGGPTGTGASIADNTVTWAWYCLANAEVQMDNIDLAITQVVNINSVVITHG